MSLVDRAGSVSEISPRHSFSLQNFRCVHMRRQAGPVTSWKIFPYEHSSPDTRTVWDETFSTAHGL